MDSTRPRPSQSSSKQIRMQTHQATQTRHTSQKNILSTIRFKAHTLGMGSARWTGCSERLRSLPSLRSCPLFSRFIGRHDVCSGCLPAIQLFIYSLFYSLRARSHSLTPPPLVTRSLPDSAKVSVCSASRSLPQQHLHALGSPLAVPFPGLVGSFYRSYFQTTTKTIDKFERLTYNAVPDPRLERLLPLLQPTSRWLSVQRLSKCTIDL